MLSAVLRSTRAVRVSIMVVQAFIRLREMIAANKDLAASIEKIETSQRQTGSIIDVIMDEIDGIAHEIKDMKALPEPHGRKIGFRLP
jgi:hypothetical protein